MSFKTFIGTIIVGLIFFTNNFVEAYDLPKIIIEKEKNSAKKVEQEKKTVFKSDWSEFEIFEQKIKKLLEENESLPADSPERITNDKNNVFIAYYKGNMYFLDRYSIQVKKNSPNAQSWTQHIFPIGKKLSGKNSASTSQTFYTDGENFYNSSRRKNNLSEVENEEDKIFLQECFKVGYCYAFQKNDRKKFVTR